jgi:copper chaperone
MKWRQSELSLRKTEKMTSTILNLDNLKCVGCENTVSKVVSTFKGVHDVVTRSDDGTVKFSIDGDQSIIEDIKKKLGSIGYPPQGTSNTIQKAVSYVSCAKGKITNM